MYDYTNFFTYKSPEQASGHKQNGLVNIASAFGHLIFLTGLCECVWVNIFTLSPQRASSHWVLVSKKV